MNFSKKKALVWDNGYNVEHAVRLAKDFAQVWYATPWQGTTPLFKDYALGLGMEGVEKIKDFHSKIDKADLICFFDVGAGRFGQFLRSKDYRVFGACEAEELELNRATMHKQKEKFDFPTYAWEQVRGITKLKAYLEKHPNKVIKINIFRGNLDKSILAQDFFHVEQTLQKLSYELGPWKESFPFIVEDVVEGFETGLDGFFNGREFIEPLLWGVFVEELYIGKYGWENPPLPIWNHSLPLGKLLSSYKYKGAFSTEVGLNGGEAFLFDFTARFGTPFSLLYTEAIKNYSEVLWKVAGGESAVIDPTFKYVAMLPLDTNYTQEAWELMDLRGKDRNRVKLMRCTRHKDKYYAVMGEETAFVLLGLGNTIKAAIEEIRDVSERVSCHELCKAPLGQLDTWEEAVDEASKVGLIL